jgi:hypothetical protein
MRTIYAFLVFLFFVLPSIHSMEVYVDTDDSSNITKAMQPINEQDLFIHAPVQKYPDELDLYEIDRDFFSSRPREWTDIAFTSTRVLTDLVMGFFVSMPATAQIMILVGNWVGAQEDTTAASFLAAYLAITFTIAFANVWDEWIREATEFLYPAYMTCPTCVSPPACGFRDEKEIEAAMLGRFPTTIAKKNKEYYASMALLAVSSLAYAFPWLWQMLWSIEESDFTVLGYITMPLYYFTLARMFYIRARENVMIVPTSKKAENHKEVLINSVQRLQEEAKEDPNLRDRVLIATKRKLRLGKVKKNQAAYPTTNSPMTTTTPLNQNIPGIYEQSEFLFSNLFMINKNTIQKSKEGKKINKNDAYVDDLRKPIHVYRNQKLEAWVNGCLGIGWLALSALDQKSYQSSLVKFGVDTDDAYYIALSMASFQSLSFIYITNPIFLTYSQSLFARFLNPSSKRKILEESNDTLQNNYCDDKNCSGILETGWVKTKSFVRWSVGKTPHASYLASGILLSLPILRRGLEAYDRSEDLERAIGASVPFLLQTLFFTSSFDRNFRSIYRKISTNLPSCFTTLFDCCRNMQDEEIFEELGDNAIKLIRDLKEDTRSLLFRRMIQRNGYPLNSKTRSVLTN